MARFDVYALTGTRAVPLVVDVQAELLSDIGSRVVIPLMPLNAAQRENMPRLKPSVQVNGASYRLITTDIAALPSATLGERVGNISAQRDTIVDAIDFLMQGF